MNTTTETAATAKPKATHKYLREQAIATDIAKNPLAAQVAWDLVRKASKTAAQRVEAKSHLMECEKALRAVAATESMKPTVAKVLDEVQGPLLANPRDKKNPGKGEIVDLPVAKAEKTAKPKAEKKTAEPKPKKVAVEEEKEDALAVAERRRAKENGLQPGTKLEHKRRGEVLATCTYVGERDFRFRNTKYTSISAAANAAAEALGMKSRTLNGWLFWGVEKREP